VRLWDLATQREQAVLRGHGDGSVSNLRFSPCGRTLLSGGLSPGDFGVVWWDVAKGAERHNWGPQDSTVQGLAWACAGRYVVVGVELTEDPIRPLPGRIRFWDNALQRECNTLEGPSEGLSNLACVDTAGATLLALVPRRERNILLHHTALPCPPAPPPLPRRPRPAEATLRKATLALWDELASDDAGVAYRAVLRLATTPRQTLALMRQKLAVAPPSDARAIEGHVADLGSEAFAARQAAEKALSALGERAVPWLRGAIEGPDLERRKRAERLLKQTQAPLRDGDRLREVRAIETLEMLADTEARELLNELAQGAPEARLTREARLAYGRLAQEGK
jgi:hypothetical protein